MQSKGNQHGLVMDVGFPFESKTTGEILLVFTNFDVENSPEMGIPPPNIASNRGSQDY